MDKGVVCQAGGGTVEANVFEALSGDQIVGNGDFVKIFTEVRDIKRTCRDRIEIAARLGRRDR